MVGTRATEARLTSARTASRSSLLSAAEEAARSTSQVFISVTCHSARRLNDRPSARVTDTSSSGSITPSATSPAMVRSACTSPSVKTTAAASSLSAKPKATQSRRARSSGTPARSATSRRS